MHLYLIHISDSEISDSIEYFSGHYFSVSPELKYSELSDFVVSTAFEYSESPTGGACLAVCVVLQLQDRGYLFFEGI